MKEYNESQMEKAFVEWSEEHSNGELSGLCRKIFYAGWEAKEQLEITNKNAKFYKANEYYCAPKVEWNGRHENYCITYCTKCGKEISKCRCKITVN